MCDQSPRNDEERRAEDLIIELGIDPRNLEAGRLEHDLRNAMRVEFPDIFDRPEMAPMADSDFVANLGIDAAQLRAAAVRVTERSAVLGRPLFVTGTDFAGGSTSMADAVDRVAGTARTTEAVSGALLMARTTGAFNRAHARVGGQRPTVDYGMPAILDGVANDDYALESILATTDTVAAAMAWASTRDDLQRWEAGGLVYADAIDLSTIVLQAAREHVRYRLDVCVGQPSGLGAVVDVVELELLGSGDDAESFELWWGETGLQCATRGNVEGVPCDESLLRITATPTVQNDAIVSGFSANYLRWTITQADVPQLLQPGPGEPIFTGLPQTGRIYVTRRASSDGSPGRRIAIAGTTLEAGTDTGEFSRCTQLVAGPAVGAMLEENLAASPDSCWRAANTCAGVPLDLRLALEDELSEAGEGADDIESSFIHYLRLAQRASAEADRLGQELIETGLQMDLRAEAAADALQDLCGPVVNVGAIPGTAVTASCGSDADCAEREACIGLRCQAGSVADMVPDEDPEADSLRRCLGELGEPQTVSLGSTPMCVYRRPGGGAACACDPDIDEVVCPPCPFAQETPDCIPRDPGTGTVTAGGVLYERLADDGWLLEAVDATLDLVDPQFGGSLVGNCDLFARIVARADPPAGLSREEMVDAVLSEAWLSHAAAVATSSMLGFSEDLYENDVLLRGGRPWATTGTTGGGSSPDWPCAGLDPEGTELDREICDSTAGAPTVRCGFECEGLGGDAAERSVVNGELQRMLMVIGTLGGGAYPMPHAWRRLDRGVTPRTVAFDVSTALLGDPSYCGAGGGGVDCILRALSIPDYGDTGSSARCLQTVSANADPTVLDHVYGVCPSLHVRHEQPMIRPRLDRRGPVFVRQAAINQWASAGAIDSAISEFYTGSVAPGDMVSWLNIRPQWDADDFRRVFDGDPRIAVEDVLRDETLWYTGPGSANVSYGELMRSLELMCLANSSGGASSCGTGRELPTIRTVDDLSTLSTRIRCAADAFEGSVERLILEDVPADVVAQIRDGAIESTYPIYRGSYGQTIAELRAQLETLPAATRTVAMVLRSFSGEVDIARSQMTVQDLRRDIAMWQMVANLADQAARCASSVSLDPAAAGGTAAQCAAAAVNIAVSIATAIIGEEISDEETGQIGTGAAVRFSERLGQLDDARTALTQGFARVNGLLATLAQQQSQARRQAARVMWLDQDAVSGREFPVNRVMRARQSTLRIRYQRAHRDAIRMAYIARRAVEQRLAVDLSTMRDDMTLVPAPATWADGLCSMRGIDYSELRGDDDAEVIDYADRFVGDYVRLLELFIESYRLDQPFTDAADVAVVSMRDDLLSVRAECSVEGYNQFVWSSDLSVDLGSDLVGASGWSTQCADGERCLVALGTDASPFHAEPEGVPGVNRVVRLRRAGESRGVRLVNACPLAEVLPDGTCAAAAGGARAQEVFLEYGEHLVSWYERLPSSLATPAATAACVDDTCRVACVDAGGSALDCEAGCVDAICLQEQCAAVTLADIPFTASAMRVDLTALDADGVPLPETVPTFSTPPAPVSAAGDRWIDACEWRRVVGRFENPEAQVVRIGFEVLVASPSDGAEVAATIAAPQLEALDPGAASLATVLPLPFFGTESDYTGPAGFCEDTTGEVFRSELHWTRGCEYVCPDGIGGSCTAGDTPSRTILRCYHETQFDISIDEIDRGELIPTGGFALGNFNYRFNTFALNIIGTGVRDCTRSETPSACYSSGYIPYSLRHSGPFEVRNHFGELIEVPLFTGNVEHAKALASERYLTNPLSGADRGMLTDYMRTEYRGRPVDGAYRIRIYDADGFDWERVQDVQLILNYRYWTRFE